MSDSTLSSLASLFTEERAEDPVGESYKLFTQISPHLSCDFGSQYTVKSQEQTEHTELHTWCSASVNEGIFWSGLHLLLIEVKLSWGWGPGNKGEKKVIMLLSTQIQILRDEMMKEL